MRRALQTWKTDGLVIRRGIAVRGRFYNRPYDKNEVLSLGERRLFRLQRDPVQERGGRHAQRNGVRVREELPNRIYGHRLEGHGASFRDEPQPDRFLEREGHEEARHGLQARPPVREGPQYPLQVHRAEEVEHVPDEGRHPLRYPPDGDAELLMPEENRCVDRMVVYY